MLSKDRYYILESVVSMRENPLNRSRVVSQAVFSEEITLFKEEGNWCYITTSDGYFGWVPSQAIIRRESIYDSSLMISRLAAHIYLQKDIEYGPFQTLAYGSKLQFIVQEDDRWIKIQLLDGKEAYVQKGDVITQKKLKDKRELVKLSQQFLGLPYTWGGRSSFGYDCSGFVQMLYQHLHITLPRDSKQQILDQRFQSIPLKELEEGDLIFFGKTEKAIMHVGMYMDNHQFIHATSKENQPWIRVSQFDDFEWSGHKEAYYPYRIGRRLFKD